MAEEKKTNMQQLKEKIEKRRGLVSFIIVFLGIIFIMMLGRAGSQKAPSPSASPEAETTNTGWTGVPPADVYTEKIEQQQLSLKEMIDKQNERIEKLEKEIQGMKDFMNVIQDRFDTMQSDLNKKADETFKRIEEKVNEILPPTTEGQQGQYVPPAPPPPTLKVSSFKPKKASKKTLFLPSGSFVRGTLLTGVFAPADKSNPLPVLIAVDEAFYGPSLSKVPLKGAFMIGKCVADLNSSRAIIQLVSFSYVFPDGRVVEKEINGYVAGEDGILGVPGKIIRRAGKELSGSFLAGFMSGLSQAFAMNETTQSTFQGSTTTAITGSATKYGLYSGLASASQKIADYYAKQLEEIITAVKVEKGKKIYLVIQKGVEIET